MSVDVTKLLIGLLIMYISYSNNDRRGFRALRRRVYQAPLWQFLLTMAAVVLEIAEINQFLPEVGFETNIHSNYVTILLQVWLSNFSAAYCDASISNLGHPQRTDVHVGQLGL